MIFFASISLLSFRKVEIVHEDFRKGIYLGFKGALNILAVVFFSLDLTFELIFTVFIELFITGMIQ